jgi:putative oxidoreductase
MNPRLRFWIPSPLVSLVFRWFLGFVFIYAGVMKASDPHGFADILCAYRLLPEWVINPVAILLPWIEIVVGVSLFLGIWIQGGALVASSMLTIFAFALGINLLRGLAIDCGCFGAANCKDPISWLYLVRDILLLAIGAYVFFFDQGVAALDRVVGRQVR